MVPLAPISRPTRGDEAFRERIRAAVLESACRLDHREEFARRMYYVRSNFDDNAEGFVRVHVRKGTDQIIGGTIVAEHAGDLNSELTLAMTGKLGLK